MWSKKFKILIFLCAFWRSSTPKQSHWLYVVSITLGDFLLISYLENIVSTETKECTKKFPNSPETNKHLQLSK
jgi:hypothetical protein